MNPDVNGRKPILGLVGGMGSGKTRVAEELARRGGRVISGDEWGHRALRDPAIQRKVVARWGLEAMESDGVSRRKLGRIVFADPAERRALEEMVFPFIGEGIRREIRDAQDDPSVRFVVLDAAVMLEAGWNGVCDVLVFVDVPREVRLCRLAEQRGWTEAEVDARERAQWTLEEKKRRADLVLDNTGTEAELADRVDRLLENMILDIKKTVR